MKLRALIGVFAVLAWVLLPFVASAALERPCPGHAHDPHHQHHSDQTPPCMQWGETAECGLCLHCQQLPAVFGTVMSAPPLQSVPVAAEISRDDDPPPLPRLFRPPRLS